VTAKSLTPGKEAGLLAFTLRGKSVESGTGKSVLGFAPALPL
jgi:hypothetical protein